MQQPIDRNEVMTPERADRLARCFVNGMRLHGKTQKMEPDSGEFSQRFILHPWVRESITEGWDRELRGHLIRVVKIRLMKNERYDTINDLMPDKNWVEERKKQAARFGDAAKWQNENLKPNFSLGVLLSALAKQADIKYDAETGEIG